MNVQDLRKALLMASDAAEVRLSFREVLIDGDFQTDTAAGGTCYSLPENTFTIYEVEDACPSVPLEPESASPDSPSPGPSPA